MLVKGRVLTSLVVVLLPLESGIYSNMLGIRSVEFQSSNDVAFSNYMNAKTPGRGLLKTPGRTTVKNRAVLPENAVYHAGGAMTVHGKGKLAQAHTPFHPATIQARKAAQSAMKPSVIVSRPLGDKTPFPNRQQPPLQTPAPQAAKIAKLSLLEGSAALMQTPGALLLPSARRKSLRARNSESGGRLNFKTPVTGGNHWDVSDDCIEVDTSEAPEEMEGPVEDTDEIEYMPPKLTEYPYEPPFDMPDHQYMGQVLLGLAHSFPIDDAAESHYAQDIDEQVNVDDLLKTSGAFLQETLELPALDDEDPFSALIDRKPHPNPKAISASRSSESSRSLATTTASQVARSSTRIVSGSTDSNIPRPASTTPQPHPTAKQTPRSATSVGVRPTRTALLRQAANSNQKSANSSATTTALTTHPKTPAAGSALHVRKPSESSGTLTRQPSASTASARVRSRGGSVAKVQLNPSLVTKVDDDLWIFKDGGVYLFTNDSNDFRFDV